MHPKNDYEVIHSDRIILVDKDGNELLVLGGTEENNHCKVIEMKSLYLS